MNNINVIKNYGNKMDKIITVEAKPNIAFVKYWGKRDLKLNLPKNSSISMTLSNATLDGEPFKTVTSLVFSDKLNEDEFYLNGKKIDTSNKDEAKGFWIIDYIRNIAEDKRHVMLVSNNSFPTSNGLASSASGLAAMAYATVKALDLDISDKELSTIARMGSGSASRSIYGGIVLWHKGEKEDGSDSYSEPIKISPYWNDLVDLICITNSTKKKVSSTAGMQTTVQTSEFYRMRPDYAEKNIKEIMKALEENNFNSFANIIMKDSNNMHATMMDSKPPIIYINDISKDIINSIEELNKREGENIAAYTLDAGPNPHIIVKKENIKKVEDAIKDIEGIEKILKVQISETGCRLLGDEESLIKEDGLKLIPK